MKNRDQMNDGSQKTAANKALSEVKAALKNDTLVKSVICDKLPLTYFGRVHKRND